jgi:hypothetical protein
MGKKSTLFSTFSISVVLFGVFALAVGSAEVPDKKIETKGVAKKCLACHGSYDKIRETTAEYKVSDTVTVNPHQYVPHKEKTDIPDCTECHLVEHPIPLEDKSKVFKPKDLSWCYSSCHHMSNFNPCSACH